MVQNRQRWENHTTFSILAWGLHWAHFAQARGLMSVCWVRQMGLLLNMRRKPCWPFINQPLYLGQNKINFYWNSIKSWKQKIHGTDMNGWSMFFRMRCVFVKQVNPLRAGDALWRHRFDIGLCNGLLPDSTNPLPQPMISSCPHLHVLNGHFFMEQWVKATMFVAKCSWFSS